MAYLIHQRLWRSADIHPNRVALIDRGGAITYAELARRAQGVAGVLAGLGVRAGTPVALACDKSIDAIGALYGVLAAGGAYVPIDPLSPPERAARIVENCRVRHLVASPERAEKLVVPMLEHREACASLEHVMLTSPPAAASALASVRERVAVTGPVPSLGAAVADGPTAASPIELDLAYILHTSGSTGTPKGVAITHQNTLAFVDMCVEFFAVTPEDRLVGHAPLHFDLSVFDLFVAASAGAAVVLVPPFLSAFPAKLAALIDDHAITIWNSVASALTLMIDRGRLERRSLASLRAVIFSGEVMPVRTLRALRGHMPDAVLYNVYGQTEANSSTYYRVGEVPVDDSARLPIGRPFPNFDVFAIDPEGREIDRPGVEGELHVRAATVAAGYYRDATRTAERFVADPRDPVTGGRVYRTGDRVSLDENGDYVFRGRTDNLIKTRGYRVELGEVELALSACAGVGRAAVVAVPDDAVGHRLHGFVSPRPGTTLVREAIIAACGARLPAYMVPETLAIRDALPHTSTGKVDRNALRSELMSEPNDST